MTTASDARAKRARRRVPIKVHPDAREALRNLLASHPAFRSSGIGYSEFIMRCVREAREVADSSLALAGKPLREFGDLDGADVQPIRLQGGVVFLKPYGCANCGNAFWTEDDDKRRLPPGPHPCPHCGVKSVVA